MKKIDYKSQLKRYPLVIIAVVFLIAMFVTSFIRGEIVADNEAIKIDSETGLSKIRRNIAAAKLITPELERLEELTSEIDARLIDPEERAINTEFFYQFGRDNNITVSEVKQAAPENNIFGEGSPNKISSNRVIRFNLSLAGSYPKILNFINKLQSVDQFIRASDVALSEKGTEVSGQIILFVLAQK